MGFFHSSGECHEQAYLQASFDHVRAVCTSGAGRRATNVESVQGLGSIGKRPVIPTPPPVPNPAAPRTASPYAALDELLAYRPPTDRRRARLPPLADRESAPQAAKGARPGVLAPRRGGESVVSDGLFRVLLIGAAQCLQGAAKGRVPTPKSLIHGPNLLRTGPRAYASREASYHQAARSRVGAVGKAAPIPTSGLHTAGNAPGARSSFQDSVRRVPENAAPGGFRHCSLPPPW